uniref:von Hippel-Lindau disease tumor suppressor-like n=1 Tax=Saccoglossus kowalevskii TaxID=10224 RepID=A0ABM0GMQ2_SACKO|nr:PREDICTED: von Hippel-Lindau disease tumor suppressor-like [Saccoglossus kowalevskii]
MPDDRWMPRLKSKISQERAFVRFLNRSTRIVDVFWINFRGQRVNYVRNTAGLCPGQYFEVNTFAGHPWIFRDRETNDKLQCGSQGQEVYFPVGWNGEFPPSRTNVLIDVPVYSLVERSMQIIRKIVCKKDIEDLEIPKPLKHQLLHPDDLPVWYPDENPECVLAEEDNDQG